MTMQRREIVRETGIALAVLAIWLLSLLAPLHQVSRLVDDFARAGVSVSAWSLCIPLDKDRADGNPPAVICPAKALGKDALVPAETGAPVLLATTNSWATFGPGAAPSRRSRRRSRPGNPRAPPISG